VAAQAPLFYFPSLYLLIQVSTFATAYQFAIPGIADAAVNKKSILSTFATACITSLLPFSYAEFF
jgi:hypothetical protein